MPNAFNFIVDQFSAVPKPDVDLSGQTVLVTGANSGLGFEAAKQLVQLKCSTVVITCRTAEKGEAAKQEILKHARDCKRDNVDIVIIPLEMTSFSSVASAAERCRGLPRLDKVILNAGVDLFKFSLAEGYETTITVNVISTFLLATLLVPVLRSSALQHNTQPTITVVGSLVHFFANSKELTKPAEGQILTSLSDPKKANMGGRYNLSKLPVMLMVQHMAEILSKSAQNSPQTKPLVVINNSAPGLCNTGLFDKEAGATTRFIVRMTARTAEVGGRTLVHGGTAGQETHGQYLSECQVKTPSNFVKSAEGHKTAEKVWNELAAIYERVKPGCTTEL